MKRFGQFLALGLVTAFFSPTPHVAADSCCGTPSYRVVPQTICQPQPVTTYRLQYETVWQERQIVSQRPVWETELRERRYTVARPVMETSEREERYTVLRPVWETTYRDASYDRVRMVAETGTRQERRIVNRPVWETQTREQRVVVQRPVTETVMQARTRTTLQPVTTYRPVTVDQGQFMDQWSYTPGRSRNRLTRMPANTFVDPVTGQTRQQRRGLYWVPNQAPGTYQVNRVWAPNLVQTQVPQTSMVPQTVVEKVPVQVTRMEQEVQVRNYPVQVCRMEQHEEVREVPVTVQRPVTERVEQKIPVQVCRWERQEMVRRVPVSTVRYEHEQRVEQFKVQVCRMVTEQRTVQVPHTVAKWVQHTTMRPVSRTVVMRVPTEPTTYVGPVTTTQSIMIPDAPAVVSDRPAVTVRKTPSNETGQGRGPSSSVEARKPVTAAENNADAGATDDRSPEASDGDAGKDVILGDPHGGVSGGDRET